MPEQSACRLHEAMFACALIAEAPVDVIPRVLGRYMRFRDGVEPMPEGFDFGACVASS